MFCTQQRHAMGGHFRPAILVVIVLLVCPIGCSKEEMKKAYDNAAAKTQELAAPVVEKVEEALPESGNVTLEMTPVAEMKSADIVLLQIGGGRPNVVQIMTYDPAARSRSYPALLLQGTTTATSASTLSGTLDCDMYFQSTATSPIAMTKPGSSVVVTFGQFNAKENAVTATLGMADLMGSDGQKVVVRGGSLLAVVNEGGN